MKEVECKMKNPLDVGIRIRNVREELNMTRSVFSEKLGISESYLTQLELGIKSLGMSTLIAICNYTGYSADYFLFGNEVANEDLLKKATLMLSTLSKNSLSLVYDIICAVKSYSDIN